MTPATRTIPELVRDSVEASPDRTWLVAPDLELTYAEAQDRIERAAAALRALGVQPGDRVLHVARNEPGHLLTWLALMEVGAIQVPVNPKGTEAELQGFVDQVRPSLVLTDVDDLFDAATDGRGPATVDHDDVAVMIPTSGTTGRSKLVMQTHRAYVMAGEGFPWWLELTADDRLMTSLPLFHVNAPAYSTLGSIAAGASLVLLPAFSGSGFLDQARRFGATQFNSIGAMLEILLRQPQRDDDADTPLRLCYTGPSPAKDRHLEAEERFGLRITCGYALSESPYGTVWRHGTRPYGTLGAVRQHPTLGTVNEGRVMADGVEVPVGGEGELELRNPAVMKGYYEMPEETAAVLGPDGWLKTGDLVRRNDDETYTFIGRKKEVIRRRGENLSPAEVEAALERHPDVAEAAVVGVESDLSEEEVKAFVVPAPGATIDVEALKAHAAEHLARFKVPRWWEVVDELPHTATDRIAKHQLPKGRTEGEVDLG
ncbi:MAG TPA: AMP-binding protein [Acidimicrobiales bacterium]|nr:AMP-binding protein [Acidimicrobiales bacterium]